MVLVPSPDTLEEVRMGLEHEKETKEIGEQKGQSDTEIERLFVSHRFVAAKNTAKSARNAQADHGNQHHGGVYPRGYGIVLLFMVSDSSEYECDSQRQKNICQNSTGERGAYH